MPDLHLSSGAYALDSLDDVERRAFERHLRDCTDCAEEVTDFYETTAMLADRVATTPPPAMRLAVLDQIARTRQISPARAKLPRFSWRSVVTSAAAVLIAAGAATGGVAYEGHRSEQSARTEAAGIARVYADPAHRTAQGRSSVGGNATVVVAHGAAVVAADRLPAVPSGKAYQIWVVQDGNARSAGLFRLKDGSGQALIKDVPTGASVAVTVEPDGGSKQPTTEPVVNLQAV